MLSQNIRITEIYNEFAVIQEESVHLIEEYDILLHLINLTQCKILIDQLKSQYLLLTNPDSTQKEELNTLEVKIETILPHHIIHKRGLINIIGKGLKIVYGTMDDDDRIDIEERLKALEESNSELIQNNNKQIIINTQFNEQFKQIQGIFRQSIKTLNKYKSIENEINTLRIELEFNKNLERVQGIIEKINDIIMTSRTGMLTQDILTIQEIYEYNINIEKLKEIKLTLATYNENLLIILNIPKFSKKLYNKINVQTFPIKNKIITIPNENVLEYNKNIFEITKEEINLKETKDECIKNLFKENKLLNCKTQSFYQKNVVINKGQYLILKNFEKQRINQTCNNLEYTLEGNYILEIKDCTIEINNKKYNRKIYQDDFKLIPILNYNFSQEYEQELKFKSIANLNVLEVKIPKKHVTYGITTIIIVTIVVIIFIFYFKKGSKNTITNVNLPKVELQPLEDSKGGGVITTEQTKRIF